YPSCVASTRAIETRSLPTSLAATHRGFTFYVPLPKSSIPSISTCSMPLIPTAPFAGASKNGSPKRPGHDGGRGSVCRAYRTMLKCTVIGAPLDPVPPGELHGVAKNVCGPPGVALNLY